MIGYGFSRSLELPLDRARERVIEALKREGFGVLMEIPLHEKLKEKIGVDYRRYHILGACNPPAAYRALQAEEDIGLMLPCNVVLYEKDGRTVLSIIRPTVAMEMIDNPNLQAVAEETEAKLKRVFESAA